MTRKEMEALILSEVDAQQLMDHAEYITSRDRESGSPGEKVAAEYFRKVMTEFGLDVNIHYVENYISLPVKGSITMSDGKVLPSCITHSYGASTGPDGLTGEAVYYTGSEDVQGKIAVMWGLASAVPCKKLENAGAIGIICITSGEYPHNMSISPIWGQPVPDTVDLISKIPVITVNSPDGEVLLAALEKGDNKVRMDAEVSTKFRTVPICEAVLKADKPTDRFVMFGGHLDSWHKGGADNGGSNAVILELARVFAKHTDMLNVNIRFLWWSGHSNGRYSGSNWYADTNWEDIHDNAVMNFDINTVGTKGSTSFDHIECNKQCYDLGRSVVLERTGQDPHYMRIQRNGDQSFWAMGVPTLFECLSLQPAEGAGKGTFMPGLPWYWHTTQDLFQYLGRDELLRDAQIFALAIWRVVSADVWPFQFSYLAGEMKADLDRYQELAQNAFSLESIQSQVTVLGEKFKALDTEIQRLRAMETLAEDEAKKAEAVNNLVMTINRDLIPVHYCENGDLFQVDLAIPIPAFPGFAGIKDLVALDPESDMFKFQERQLMRNRTRVHYYLNQAIKHLEEAGF